MARDTTISNWYKENRDLLIRMRDKGHISTDDLRKINNKKGDYGIQDQNDALKIVTDEINKRYSAARLDSIRDQKGLSKDRIDRIDEFTKLRKSVEKFDKKSNLLRDKLIEQIKNSGIVGNEVLEGLIPQIEKISSDQELKEYLFDIRGYLDRALPNAVLSKIPDLEKYIDKKPKYGVYDSNFDKMFEEKDILDKFYEIPYRRIKNIAEENGMTGEELLDRMRIAKTAKDREAIAHGRWNTDASIPENIANEIGGTLLTLFGRRQQEAIERGEDPKLKDIAGDVGEQVAYMVPLGRMAGPVAKVAARLPKGQIASKIAPTVTNFGSNAIVPTASELYDAMAYDDDNPRGEFSIADPIVGSTVNWLAPYAVRRLGSTLGRVADSKKIQKGWAELAEGKTAKEIVGNKYKGVKTTDATNPNVSTAKRQLAQELESIKKADPDIGNVLQQKEPFLAEIAEEPGEHLGEKAKRYVNRKYPEGGYTLLDVDGSVNAPTVEALYKTITDAGTSSNPELSLVGKMGKFMPEELAKYEAKPNVVSDRLMKVYDEFGLDAVKTARELLIEDLWKNYLTNQFGNFVYADGNVSIPGLNLLPDTFDINQLLKEHAEKKERDKKEKESQDRTRYRIEADPQFERLLKGILND